MKAKPRSLLNEVQLFIILISMAIIVAVVGVSLSIVSHTMLVNLKTRSINTANEMATFLEHPLYAVDDEQAVRIAETFLSSGKISGIVLESTAKGTLLSDTSGKDSLRIPKISRNIYRDGLLLGKIAITFSDAEIVRTQTSFAIIFLAIMIAVLLVNIAANRYIIARRVRRPFDTIFTAIRNISEGNYETLIKPTPYWDLNVLVSLFNDMAGKIHLKNQEQKNVESALRESERKFRAIFNQTFQLTVLLSPDGRVLVSNQAALSFSGIEEKDVLNTFFWETVWWRHSPQEQRNLRDVLKQAASGIFVRMEASHLDVKGELHIFDFSIKPVFDDAGNVVLLISEGRDISERKQVEQDLRASEFRFRAFYDSNPEGVILMDFEGKIMGVNKAFASMSGFTVQEIVNRHFKEFIPADYHDVVLSAIWTFRAGIQPDDLSEMIYLRKDGGELPIAIKGWRITDEDSNPVSLGVFVRDLTIEKHLAEEKAAIEKQLQQTQKMEAIGTLAGGIAHDFNNILGGIIGYTELAMMEEGTPLDKKKQGYLSRVLSAGKRAKDLIQQILRFSRHESSAMSPISIKPIIKESIKLLRSTFPATIEIQQNIQDHLDKIVGDPTQVHQVMMNLCTNAYHAMRERGGILTISLENMALQAPREFMNLKAPPGDYIRLGISDTGQGIAPQILERIFEPYFTTKKVNEGTGLGLSVIMGIIKSHKGLISVESELEKGTRFDVYFPVVQAISPETADRIRFIPTGNQERILVVDDEAFFLDVVKENLEALEYQVIANCSSLKTLEILKDNPTGFDLVITDQTMPEMTGLQLVAEIRNFNSDIPIILCTGYSEMVSEQSAKYYGITKFLLKPIIFNDLAMAVQEALQRKG